MTRFLDKDPYYAARQCSERFPINETVDTAYVVDSNLLRSYEQEFESMSLFIDSLLSAKCPEAKLEVIETIKEIPGKPLPAKVIVKTQESTARLDSLKLKFQSEQKAWVKERDDLYSDKKKLESKVSELQDKLSVVKKQRNTYLWLVIALLVWIFRKPLLKVIRKSIIKI